MGGAKVSYVLGGRGLKPDTHYRMVSPGRFTKASRNAKPTTPKRAVTTDGIQK